MAHAGNGGLQKHSIGDDYPFAVVGTIRNGVTMYYVRNLVTGETDGLFYLTSGCAHISAHDYKMLGFDRPVHARGWAYIDTSVEV